MKRKLQLALLSVLLLCTEISIAQLGNLAYPVPPGYTSQQVRNRNDLKADANNNVWVAFKLIGLGKFNSGAWTIYDTTNSPVPSNEIHALEFDNSNNTWAGTKSGLAKFDGFSWNIYNTFNSGLLSDNITGLRSDGNDLWVGTTAGAAVYDGSNWNIYNTSNSGIASDTVLNFAFGNNGEIWMGTTRGVSQFHNNVWTTFNSSNSGLTANVISTMEVDFNNDLWISAISTFNGPGTGTIFLLKNGVIKNYLNNVYDNGLLSVNLLGGNTMTKNAQGNILIYGTASSRNGFLEIKPSGTYFYFFLFNTVLSDVFGTQTDMGSPQQIWAIKGLGGSFGDSLYFFDLNTYIPIMANSITYINSGFLDINKTKALILNRGDMHQNFTDPRYESPKGTNKHSVFASSLWLGGLDANSNLHMSAQTYRQDGLDYFPGPLDTITGTTDPVTSNAYDKIWKIDRGTIANFNANFLNGNVTNGSYPVPQEILTWPAQGTGNITRDLAPFIDYNNDGSYDPYDGDYPLIKGDQMLYWIFNDNLFSHTKTGGVPFGFEIHGSAYSYYCPLAPDSEDVINLTTYYNYRIINRSQDTYHNMHIGLWCDMDIGFQDDDFSGCDTLLDYNFTYNAVADSDAIYGYNPPMQNLLLLKGPLADPGDGIDNDHDGTTDEAGERNTMTYFLKFENSTNIFYGNPVTTNDFSNYLEGKWKDGSPMTFGGNGYGGVTPVRHMFPGVPYSGSGWDEITAGDTANDGRNLLSSGPFTLAPGQETSVDWALVFSWDSTAVNGLTTSIARNVQDVTKIKYWYDNNINPSCWTVNVGFSGEHSENNSFEIFPNPVHDKLYFEFMPESHADYKFEINDLLGRTLIAGNAKEKVIPVHLLSNGVYLLQIKNGNKIYRQKFVKD
jgi:type IX secretion system substrate protein